MKKSMLEDFRANVLKTQKLTKVLITEKYY